MLPYSVYRLQAGIILQFNKHVNRRRVTITTDEARASAAPILINEPYIFQIKLLRKFPQINKLFEL